MSGARRYFLRVGLLSPCGEWGTACGMRSLPSTKALEEIGASLSTAFAGAAQRDLAQSAAALSRYRESKYIMIAKSTCIATGSALPWC